VARRRPIVIALSIVGLLMVVFVAGVALTVYVASRGPSIPQGSTLVLRPGGEIGEVTSDDLVGQLVGRDTDTVGAFVSTLHLAKRDARIANVLLMPSSLELPYWGKLQEMRDAVLDFRKSGKQAIAFLEYGGDREYYLATAANRVYLLPTSPLDVTGVASYELFLRGLLDKVGATPDFVAIGAYKTAPNQLTERKMTPAHREMTESLTREAFEQLVKGIAEGRKKDPGEVRRMLDSGPFAPEDALRLGLIDELAYEDQLDDHVPALHVDARDNRHVDAGAYRRVRPASIGIHPKSRIAVLYAVGAIVSGRGGFDPLNGVSVGSETLVEQIRRIRNDDSIKAFVLRIDSPGGSAVASDVIWRELAITRDQKPSRPLVVSMSDLAASGGYYIAMAGQTIVAQPGTLTGSIGIYSGKMALAGAAAKLGITTETVKEGANADIYSPFAPFSPAQRDKLLEFMQSFYDGFVEKVAASRHSTPEQIDAVAQGRVWTGAQAKEKGLVDALGGLETAIALAKERAKIPAGEDVEVVVYPPRRTFYEVLSEGLGGRGEANIWGLLAGRQVRQLARAASPLQMFRSGEPLAIMPMAFMR
jgi:protease-4